MTTGKGKLFRIRSQNRKNKLRGLVICNKNPYEEDIITTGQILYPCSTRDPTHCEVNVDEKSCGSELTVDTALRYVDGPKEKTVVASGKEQSYGSFCCPTETGTTSFAELFCLAGSFNPFVVAADKNGDIATQRHVEVHEVEQNKTSGLDSSLEKYEQDDIGSTSYEAMLIENKNRIKGARDLLEKEVLVANEDVNGRLIIEKLGMKTETKGGGKPVVFWKDRKTMEQVDITRQRQKIERRKKQRKISSKTRFVGNIDVNEEVIDESPKPISLHQPQEKLAGNMIERVHTHTDRVVAGEKIVLELKELIQSQNQKLDSIRSKMGLTLDTFNEHGNVSNKCAKELPKRQQSRNAPEDANGDILVTVDSTKCTSEPSRTPTPHSLEREQSISQREKCIWSIPPDSRGQVKRNENGDRASNEEVIEENKILDVTESMPHPHEGTKSMNDNSSGDQYDDQPILLGDEPGDAQLNEKGIYAVSDPSPHAQKHVKTTTKDHLDTSPDQHESQQILDRISSMKAAETEKEPNGIPTPLMVEKREPVDALTNARAVGGIRIAVETLAKLEVYREKLIHAEAQACNSMTVSEMKRKLESVGVQTNLFLEKKELSWALAEARIGGMMDDLD